MRKRRKMAARFGQCYMAAHPLTTEQRWRRAVLRYGLLPWQAQILRRIMLDPTPLTISHPRRSGLHTLRVAAHYATQVLSVKPFITGATA